MSATRVVLDLATASPDTEFSTAVLTRAGEIVGVSASSIRVAAGRLCRENKLRRTARGNVRPQPGRHPHLQRSGGWRTRTDRIRPWDGTWIAVEHSGLKRSDRTAARRHDQALRLAGFEEWKPHSQSDRTISSAARAAPAALSTDSAPPPNRPSWKSLTLPPRMTIRPSRTLWNSEALLADIAEAREALTQAQTRLATISREEAARESLALGSAVIAVIVRNPLPSGKNSNRRSHCVN